MDKNIKSDDRLLEIFNLHNYITDNCVDLIKTNSYSDYFSKLKSLICEEYNVDSCIASTMICFLTKMETIRIEYK